MKKNSGKTGVAGDTPQDPRKPLLIIGGRSKKKSRYPDSLLILIISIFGNFYPDY